MTVAPELFTPEHALSALKVYHAHLVGPLGVATLDPADSDYRPHYDNANDGHDRAIAKGWNYHQVCSSRALEKDAADLSQGPEWVWPLGYFLRAYLYFDTRVGAGTEVCCGVLSREQPLCRAQDPSETIHHIGAMLLRHREHIRSDAWAGLPELTNKAGEHCRDSVGHHRLSYASLLTFLAQCESQAWSAGTRELLRFAPGD